MANPKQTRWIDDMALPFSKYHGLGNDFILVHEGDLPADVERSELATRLCDRNFGVGADGLLILSWSDRADARMVVINSDGSRPEMCGNGIRCFALHLSRTLGPKPTYMVETDAGDKYCDMELAEGVPRITVNMGRADFSQEACRIARSRRTGALDPVEVVIDGERMVLRLASMGNPHGVIVVRDDQADLGALARRFGPRIGAHLSFPEGINVEWTRRTPEGLELVVYERGAGLTMACGTGACATVAVAHRAGLLDASNEVAVDLPGGRLWISIDTATSTDALSGPVAMSGPATFVFAGTIVDETLLAPNP